MVKNPYELQSTEIKRPALGKNGPSCHAETTSAQFLETDEGAESHTRIMMCASGKVDFIPRFKPQTNRADVPFETRTRIERSADVVRAQVIYRADESGKAGGPGIQPEIDKTSLNC